MSQTPACILVDAVSVMRMVNETNLFLICSIIIRAFMDGGEIVKKDAGGKTILLLCEGRL